MNSKLRIPLCWKVRLYDKLKRLDVVDTMDRSRLQYDVPLSDNSEHFYTPLPFSLSTSSLQTLVDANASAFLRPPTATYLAGPTAVATNNVHFPSRGLTLRDTATSYEVQVVSPEAFVYYVGTTTATAYAPSEATLLAECMAKQDRTQTDDPGYPEFSFVLEPLENDPSHGYQTFTSRFSITSGAQRSDSAAGAWGASVCAPMPAVVVPGGQAGPLAGAAHSFFSVPAPNVEIVAVKRPSFGDPADVVVRVRERDGVPASTSLQTSFSVLAAWECTLLEQSTTPLGVSPVPITLGPYETKTLRLRLAPSSADGRDTVGVYAPAAGVFFLRNTNAAGPADLQFGYGPAGAGWIALSGDWDGDGDATPGLYDPASGAFFLRNANGAGPADVQFAYGPGGLGWKPLVGDWDGDGRDTVGLYDPSSGVFFLRNSNTNGPATLQFGYGPPGAGWLPLAGDWDGDGVDTIGLYAPATSGFFLRNSNSPGPAALAFQYGPPGLGWVPLVGDWDGDGVDTVGLYAPTASGFFLRNGNSAGAADLAFAYGPPNVVAVVGNWDGS